MNDKKVTVIAEACQNHKGDLHILKDMIYAAKEAGADYIKIQSMLADELTARDRFERGVRAGDIVKAIQRPYKAEYDRLKPLDLDDDAHRIFIDTCAKAGIKPLTTVFTFSRIPFLASLPWNEIKIASYDCASFPFLKELMGKFKHLYISTGATYDDEIKTAANILGEHPFSFLHCVTIYPTPLDQLHFNRMLWLKNFTSSVGFSDHSLVARDGLKATFAALYMGADIIERHFTVLKHDETRDGPVSVTPGLLREIVEFSKMPKESQKQFVEKNIPEFENMLGVALRQLSTGELLNRDYYRGRFASHADGKTRYNWEE